jgi:hypothetical protein
VCTEVDGRLLVGMSAAEISQYTGHADLAAAVGWLERPAYLYSMCLFTSTCRHCAVLMRHVLSTCAITMCILHLYFELKLCNRLIHMLMLSSLLPICRLTPDTLPPPVDSSTLFAVCVQPGEALFTPEGIVLVEKAIHAPSTAIRMPVMRTPMLQLDCDYLPHFLVFIAHMYCVRTSKLLMLVCSR